MSWSQIKKKEVIVGANLIDNLYDGLSHVICSIVHTWPNLELTKKFQEPPLLPFPAFVG
jgi:hypothetical protein